MLEYWKQHRALKRRLAKINELYVLQQSNAISDDASLKISAQHISEKTYLEMELEVLETERLLEVAAKYGIEATPPKGMHVQIMTGAKPRYYFEGPNKAKMYRMISDARYDWWKK
jgi:hypothetical protein